MKYKYLFLSLGFLLLLGISGCNDARKELTGDYDYYLYFSNTMDKFVTSGRFVGIGKKDQVILKTEGLELSYNMIKKSFYLIERMTLFIHLIQEKSKRKSAKQKSIQE